MLNWLESLSLGLRRWLSVAFGEGGAAGSGERPGESGESGESTDPGETGATDAPDETGEIDIAGRPDGPEDAELDASTVWCDLLDGGEVSRQEVQMELGLQPHEFLVWLIRDAGGHMWQTDVVDTTGWSKSTVSRYLDTLESNEAVQRVWVGRRKLVGIPGAMPDCVPAAERSPVGSPTSPVSSWSAEADELA